MMCFAKGITSGYIPMGATLCSNQIYEAFLGTPGDGKEFRHGNTYSGHATAAAAALANVAWMSDSMEFWEFVSPNGQPTEMGITTEDWSVIHRPVGG